jgi:molybdopterin-guanine dinucleotide biosynthesis protein A
MMAQGTPRAAAEATASERAAADAVDADAVSPDAMTLDAVILAGGRSSRLGTDKAALVVGSRTLLAHALAAAEPAGRRVVVGPRPAALPSGAMAVREDPAFSGPAAALATGFAALAGAPGPVADAVLVLACDMPRVADAVPALRAALAVLPETDGVIAVDSGRRQPLAAIYRSVALRRAIGSHARLAGMSMRDLVSSLHLTAVPVAAGATMDIDDWDDAASFGVPPQDGGS